MKANQQSKSVGISPTGQGAKTMLKGVVWPVAQEDIRHYRALGSICRQQAALHPEASWTWLSQAEKWEDLAEAAAPPLSACHDTSPTPEPVPLQKAG